jgi:hypothetical protein
LTTERTVWDGSLLDLFVMDHLATGASRQLTRTPFFYECTAVSLLDLSKGEVSPLTSCQRQRESTRSPAWQPDPDAQDRGDS